MPSAGTMMFFCSLWLTIWTIQNSLVTVYAFDKYMQKQLADLPSTGLCPIWKVLVASDHIAFCLPKTYLSAGPLTQKPVPPIYLFPLVHGSAMGKKLENWFSSWRISLGWRSDIYSCATVRASLK